MKLKKNSLTVQIWFFLILFSTIILVFLWLFQVVFAKHYYKWETKKMINKVSEKIEESYEEANDINLDNLAYENNLCIEIIEEGRITYTSNQMRRGCLFDNLNLDSFKYKNDFIISNKNEENYNIINPRLKNETLVHAFKINDNVYAFVNTSLEPIDSTIVILKNQLIIVTFGVLVLSFVIAFYISKKISKPIISINENAKGLAKGEYQYEFKSESDIEEINQLINTLNYARGEMSKTDELRRDLMANVSHDLKTPLTMIKAYAEMSRDLNKDNEFKRTDNLNIIIEESDRLNILVNDILELSKNESNMSELKYENFDLTTVIKLIIKRYDIFSQTENYKFIFNYKKKLIINADKQKIEQVIYNLMNNAINYTGKDKKVEVLIENMGDYTRVSIKDTGKGIDESDIDKIWNKYYKSDKKHKRNIIGTGLGLSIVKSILINHKYKYGVTSKKGKGSTFYFDIDSKDIL